MMGLWPRATLMLVAVLAIAGCASRGGDIPYNRAGFVAPDAPVIPAPSATHRLLSGDTISIRVYRVDSLSSDQVVDSGGNVTLPLIGDVPAAGKTTQELAKELAERLGQRYLSSPNVAVTLKATPARTATVDGSVQSPGLYPIGSNSTLLQLIAQAHGTAEDANPKRVVIFRQIGGQRMAASFDLTTIRHGQEPDPAVFADDLIVVDGSSISRAFRTALQSLPFATLFRPY